MARGSARGRASTAGVLVGCRAPRLAYEVTGAGAPVLLVHGFGLGHAHVGNPQVEHLAGRFRVVALRLPRLPGDVPPSLARGIPRRAVFTSCRDAGHMINMKPARGPSTRC